MTHARRYESKINLYKGVTTAIAGARGSGSERLILNLNTSDMFKKETLLDTAANWGGRAVCLGGPQGFLATT